ncbi:hypothetical protein RSSM_06324 [Rhodopirellula sallentina SM41]|uniref:Uncharacterized protein n=1 Tax=Rhodopirellula sallentina SM41 TaxID=1263870 RepID=M5TSU1_9BACT|nr:hypothetical protein RSSM_06324 [Rhodopirellula sallentina SM41]
MVNLPSYGSRPDPPRESTNPKRTNRSASAHRTSPVESSVAGLPERQSKPPKPI